MFDCKVQTGSNHTLNVQSNHLVRVQAEYTQPSKQGTFHQCLEFRQYGKIRLFLSFPLTIEEVVAIVWRFKASVRTGRTCLVIVRVLRVLPVVALVADRSVKHRIEAIESATSNKPTFNVPVSSTLLIRDGLLHATCDTSRNGKFCLTIIVQHSRRRPLESLSYRCLSLPNDRCMDNYKVFALSKKYYFLKHVLKWICRKQVNIETTKKTRRKRILLFFIYWFNEYASLTGRKKWRVFWKHILSYVFNTITDRTLPRNLEKK